MSSLDDLLIPALLFQWALSVATMACGIGGGLYLGEWLLARHTPTTKRRK